jgi:hypothetical protein
VRNKNSLLSLISLVLIVFLAIPTVVKLLHTSHHISVNCDRTFKSHIHAKELDCDFHKFNISHHFYDTHFKDYFVALFFFRNEFSYNYTFIPELGSPLYSLRAPPLIS